MVHVSTKAQPTDGESGVNLVMKVSLEMVRLYKRQIGGMRPLKLWAALAVIVGLVWAPPAQARRATVYEGSYDRVGKLTGSGDSWTVYQGSYTRIGKVQRSGSSWVVYAGSYDRVGKVSCSASQCTVYEGSYDRVGKVKRQGSTWVVYEGSYTRVGNVSDAGVSGGGPAGGAALLLLP